MKKYIFLLLVALQTGSVSALEIEELESGVEAGDIQIHLHTHVEDDESDNITWALYLPDGKPLKRIGSDDKANNRFLMPGKFIQRNTGATERHLGADSVEFIVKANKSARFLSRFFGKKLEFKVRLKVTGREADFKTIPIPYLPLMNDVFLKVHPVLNERIVTFNMRSFDSTRHLIKLYSSPYDEQIEQIEQIEQVDGTAAAMMMTPMEAWAGSIVGNEMLQAPEYVYDVSPVGF